MLVSMKLCTHKGIIPGLLNWLVVGGWLVGGRLAWLAVGSIYVEGRETMKYKLTSKSY